MTEITINSITAQRELVTKFGVAMGEDPQYSMFEFQKGLVEQNPKHISLAALHDIWDIMPKGNRQDVIDSINMGIQNYGKAQSPFSAGEYQNRSTFVLDALNNSLPAILENKAHKTRHFQLIMDHANKENIKGTNTFHDFRQDVMNTIRTLYGETKVFHNNTPMKVGFPRAMLKAADVDQNEWDDSVDYFFAMAHRKYKGTLSFVPRENIVNKMIQQADWAKSFKHGGDVPEDDGTYVDAEGITRQRINTPWDPYDPKDDKWMVPQQNRMTNWNRQWKQIYQDMVTKGGGNIWIERINDSKDLNRIRLVIVAGDRNKPDEVTIIGDIYGDNQGQSETAGFTRENSIKFMQARQAWQWGNSQDDAWDPQDWIYNIVKLAEYTANKANPHLDALNNKINQTLGMAGEDTQSPLVDLDWLPIEEGGDLSREEFEVLTNRYSKGAWEKKHGRKFIQEEFEAGDYEGFGGYSDLPTNSFGGRYATEFTLPGRIEADMFLEPLWNEILAHEKSIGRKLTHSSEDKEIIYDLIKVVKARLNRNPDIYDSGTSIFSYVLNQGQDLFYQESQYQQTAITDFIGRSIKHLRGREGEQLFNIARKLSPYIPDKDRPKSKAEILDPSTWDLKPLMDGWID